MLAADIGSARSYTATSTVLTTLFMWPYPKVIAHRGGGTLAPENTLAGMRCGMEHGYRAVEFDVMLAADHVPVIVHDPQFGRTIPGTGNVSDTPAAVLQTLDAGSWLSPRFAGEPVPLLEQVLDFCDAHGMWMNIEIKPAPGYEAETGRIVGERVARRYAAAIASGVNDPLALPLFSSFSFEALMQAGRAAPGIARGFLTDRILPDWRDRLAALDAVALHTNHKYLTAAQAAEIKSAGYGLFCYTVNTPERAQELLRWGVDAFCTDRLDLIGPDPAD